MGRCEPTLQSRRTPFVIPAQAGTYAVGAAQLALNGQLRGSVFGGPSRLVARQALEIAWVPACAGMTVGAQGWREEGRHCERGLVRGSRPPTPPPNLPPERGEG